MTQRVMDQLKKKKIFSLEFFVRRNESAEQREVWRIWKAQQRERDKQFKLTSLEKVSLIKQPRPNPDTPVESTS